MAALIELGPGALVNFLLATLSPWFDFDLILKLLFHAFNSHL